MRSSRSSICFGNSSKRALIDRLPSGLNYQTVDSSRNFPIPAGSAATMSWTRRELPKIDPDTKS